MKRREIRNAVVAVGMTLISALPVIAAKPGGGGKSPSQDAATTTIHDWSPSGTAYRIRSDFAETGSNLYSDSVDGVVSTLADWYEVSALGSATRRMYVDFGTPVNPGETLPPELLDGATAGLVPGRFVSKFSGIASMTGVGSTLTGGLPFVFTGRDGMHYQVRMNSENEEGTGDAVVTCTHVTGADQGDSGAQCDAWIAVPASSDGTAIGRLVRQETKKGRTTMTYLGDYVMTFEVSITKP